MKVTNLQSLTGIAKDEKHEAFQEKGGAVDDFEDDYNDDWGEDDDDEEEEEKPQ